MSRLLRIIVIGSLLAGVVGCCSSPYRRFQDGWGWNNPVPDRFSPGPPPPITTPYGPTSPALGPTDPGVVAE